MYTKCQAPLRFCVNILPISRNKVHCEMNYWCLINEFDNAVHWKIAHKALERWQIPSMLIYMSVNAGSAYLMTIASKQSNGMYDDEYEQANDMCKVIKWCVSWWIQTIQ